MSLKYKSPFPLLGVGSYNSCIRGNLQRTVFSACIRVLQVAQWVRWELRQEGFSGTIGHPISAAVELRDLATEKTQTQNKIVLLKLKI